MPGARIPPRQLALMGIAFIPSIVLLFLDGHFPLYGPFQVIIVLTVLGVSAICSVWWFISIPRGARWLEFRPTAHRVILTGFVLTVVAIVLVPLFWNPLLRGISWTPSLGYVSLGTVTVVWPVGLYVTCGIWWSNSSPDNKMLPIIVHATGGVISGGMFLGFIALAWGSILYRLFADI